MITPQLGWAAMTCVHVILYWVRLLSQQSVREAPSRSLSCGPAMGPTPIRPPD